ncbi:MAG TPA: hypothetical protein VLV56_11065 [Burkholderiales bacterium]|nr:hypothetical protein [Burkholderiales bacterium]
MAKEELSARERALLAEARREAAARKASPPAVPAPAPGAAAPGAKPAPTPAERLAQLMADERAESQQRKIRMRRYGLAISGAIIAVFVLWLLRAFRPRR